MRATQPKSKFLFWFVILEELESRKEFKKLFAPLFSADEKKVLRQAALSSEAAQRLDGLLNNPLATQQGRHEKLLTILRTIGLGTVKAANREDVEPSKLDIDDLDAPLIGAFLDHLEKQRDNSARTRNARLAAVRSLFRYAALRHPEHAAIIERVLAIPRKRFDRRIVTFLIEPELDALFRAPDRSTWTGRRDHICRHLLQMSSSPQPHLNEAFVCSELQRLIDRILLDTF